MYATQIQILILNDFPQAALARCLFLLHSVQLGASSRRATRAHARETHARTRDRVNVVHEVCARGRLREPLGAKVKFEAKAV